MLAAVAMVITNNAHRANLNLYRVMCLRTGRYVESVTKPELSPLGKRCLELVEKDRVAIRRAIYDDRVAKLRARGVTKPGQLMKHTFGMFMGKVRY